MSPFHPESSVRQLPANCTCVCC